jgi:cytidylate kinase
MTLTIAIDGTFASGKGTLAKRLATHFDLPHLDTGKIYRATARAVLAKDGDPDKEVDALAGVKAADFTALDDPALLSNTVAQAASRLAVHPKLRAALLSMQRDFAKDGAVLDGRDIGTVILPHATVKLFVDAKAEIRAHRRWKELSGRGDTISEAEVLKSLIERDHRDANRALAPLKPAEDAHWLDTSGLDADQVFETALRLITAVRQTASV